MLHIICKYHHGLSAMPDAVTLTPRKNRNVGEISELNRVFKSSQFSKKLSKIVTLSQTNFKKSQKFLFKIWR